MKNSKIPTPKFTLIKKSNDLNKAIFSFPVMIKRLQSSASLGMKKIENKKILRKYIENREKKRGLPLLVQEYIEGDDIDLSILAKQGKIVCYTMQKWYKADGIKFFADKKVLNIGEKIVKNLGYTGLAHFDMRYHKQNNSVLVLECNPRVWGTLPASCFVGINFLKAGLDLATGKKINFYNNYKHSFYMTAPTLLDHWLSGKLSLPYITIPTLRDFLSYMTDPLPYLLSYMRRVVWPKIFRS